MSSRTKRTAAVAPAAGYSRPRSVMPCGLVATVTTEDGKTKSFDFRAGRATRPAAGARCRVRQGI